MKRLICLFLALLLCGSTVICAHGKTYSISGSDIFLDIDDSIWYVFTRDNIENNPELDELRVIVNNGKGFCKLVYDEGNDRLIGGHIVGSYASEMIYGVSLMIGTELPLEQLKKLVFPHPTVCEVVREALFAL